MKERKEFYSSVERKEPGIWGNLGILEGVKIEKTEKEARSEWNKRRNTGQETKRTKRGKKKKWG